MAASNIWAALPGKPPLRRCARGPAGGRDHKTEEPFSTDQSGNPAGRNCLAFLPPGGTSGCSATGAGATDSLQVPGRNPRVPVTYCWGTLASRPLPREPRLLRSHHPCPWHYLHVSSYEDSLAPTCFRAHLHRRGRGSTPNMASAMTDRNPRAAEASGTYTYTSRPRAVACQRRRYRDSILQPVEESMNYGNIMYDRRVIRGNTYALPTGQVPGQPDPLELQQQQQARRRALARKRAQQQLRPRTPEPVEGRKHVDVQTELYLEEIADRIVEIDMECQTDAFLDRPPTPLFIPAKTGKDVATQILEGELFDFDLEVKPMLEVLVGKTIEQALLEVMEEEELANLRASQYAYEEIRNVELAEVQRLEEQERRHREEKERRKRQQWEIVHKQNETSQKISARAFAQRYLADLLPSVFDSLRNSGYFYDPIERDIEVGFLPWLLNEVEKTMEHSMVGRTVLDMLIREVVERRINDYESKEAAQPAQRSDDVPNDPNTVPDPSGSNLFQSQASATPSGRFSSSLRNHWLTFNGGRRLKT
ncbi:radial spoke head protein 3 homolog isoform X2 [Rattus norvegicus]|uniref:Radial spoke head 3 n=1 Tax=Rattus norvegicus TaxID=10116 RepID=F1LRY1_RAT|nr:radial spoke head protein 3 homolog isoform X2 [Rattus norvegicus]|eukprot:XP_006227972.1 PREDICTED: radial spoke head protein 3 homolog isoform X3 [Rattus norvegicus]